MRKNKLLVDKKIHKYLLRNHFKWYEEIKEYINVMNLKRGDDESK